nr:PmoA family protein [Verrucomicrobiota bacterium]
MLPTNRSLAVVLAIAVCPSLAHAAIEVKELPDKVRIEINGKLFTEYVHTGTPHVCYWPLIGPGGAKMTRSWPMAEAPNEERDHPHHRSLWFSHGLVNGIDFWMEASPSATKPPKHPIGKIVHSKVLEAKGGAKQGVLKTAQNWVAADGSVPLT